MEIRKLVENYTTLEEVVIRGWAKNKRNSKNVSFLMLNDGTCFDTIQVVYANLENQEEIEASHISAAYEIKGKVVLTGKDNQPFEIVASEIIVLAASNEKYPLQPKKHSYEFLREISYLRTRSNTFNAVFRLRSVLSYAIHDYFNNDGFVMVHAPIITSSDAEGAGEMFQVTTLDPMASNEDYKDDFFGKKTSLTVSGQLLAEAFALSFSKAYTFGPTFRAENSNTTRHAAEFWMVEPEVAFADLNDNINLAQDMLIYVVKQALEKCPKEIAFLNNQVDYDLEERLNNLVNADFVRITYTEAVELLMEHMAEKKVKFDNNVFWGVDLATEHEKYLTDVVYNAPVFVTDYPKEIKAFYMKQNDDGKTVAAVDLLVPGIGELIGGSERETDIEKLTTMMEHYNLDVEEYDWYFDLRRYGGVKHSGFGMGFERLIMYVTGMENIRDVLPFPRTPNNCQF